ncbi:MAG: hypothetical protein JKX99_04970, partial [Robiginitomaculum sp.]|nr:hypothetical protein [Robiginitomaculum sp.]
AVAALAEEAKVSPPTPDPKNRNSRRFSESIKNFARSLVANAIKGGKWVKANPIKTTLALAKSSIAAAKWVIENVTWLLNTFAGNPAMLAVIRLTLEFLKRLPLA